MTEGRWELFAIELCLAAIAAAAAYAAPGQSARPFRIAERAVAYLVRRPAAAVAVVGLAALAARLAVLPILPIPQPVIHDEFSHLLLADTLLHGHLTNPTHLLWTRFESFHIIQQPTYTSMYYLGQGLLLAAGQALLGHPFWAVWLSVGLMCASICWMLQGWLPAKWALAGGFLSVIRLAVFSYWADSYFGGALPAIGGALVLGALPRLRRRPRVRYTVILALGFAVLANTRPFEGLFFGLPIGAALLFWVLGRKRPPIAVTIRRIVLPASLLLGLTAGAMGYYFWRVTGSPFRIPYQEGMKTEGLLFFSWQRPQPPQFGHRELETFYLKYILAQYDEARSHPYIKCVLALGLLWLFYLGPTLTLPLLAWPATLPRGRPFLAEFASRKTRFLLLVCVVSSVGWLLPIYLPQPHYAAASTCAVYALVAQAMRRVRRWRRGGNQCGAALVAWVPAIAVLLLLVRAAAPILGMSVHASNPRLELVRTWSSPQPDTPGRARTQAYLAQLPGRHLVVVRYKPDYDPIFNEWVYNGADIDKAAIVWAREGTPAENDELIQYFKDRTVWLGEPDENPPRLSPYGGIAGQTPNSLGSIQ